VIGPPIDCAGREPREVIEAVRAWIEMTVVGIDG